jgi:gamma-glutamyltranspeptidase/glutathione hydrolase
MAIVDASGRALAMTSTINLHFGARMAAEGMVFNNALINFAPPPPTALSHRGDRYANEMAPGKRPLSPIAPLIVLGADNAPVLVGGGAGGAPIPDTMAMTLIRVLSRGLSPAEALAAPHAHAADPDHIVLEQDTAEAALRAPLEAMGHHVEMEPVDTGNVVLLKTPTGWTGSADPRRDGGPAQGLR